MKRRRRSLQLQTPSSLLHANHNLSLLLSSALPDAKYPPVSSEMTGTEIKSLNWQHRHYSFSFKRQTKKEYAIKKSRCVKMTWAGTAWLAACLFPLRVQRHAGWVTCTLYCELSKAVESISGWQTVQGETCLSHDRLWGGEVITVLQHVSETNSTQRKSMSANESMYYRCSYMWTGS